MKPILALVALAAGGSAVFLASQGAPDAVPTAPGDPGAIVSSTYEAILGASKTVDEQESLTNEVTRILAPLISWDHLSRRTLTGGHWDGLDRGKKDAFVASYRRLIVDRYARHFRPKARFEVEVRGDTELAPDGRAATVRSTVFTWRKREGAAEARRMGVDVDYSFVVVGEPGAERWLIEDIVVDTVSRALTYRPKFVRILKVRGFDALIEAIENNAKRASRRE